MPIGKGQQGILKRKGVMRMRSLTVKQKLNSWCLCVLSFWPIFLSNECGAMGLGILAGLISVVVVLIVLGTAIPVLWPLATATSDNITAMTGTDAGTTTIQAFWPVILLVIGMGVAVGLIVYGLRKFGLIGGGSV